MKTAEEMMLDAIARSDVAGFESMFSPLWNPSKDCSQASLSKALAFAAAQGLSPAVLSLAPLCRDGAAQAFSAAIEAGHDECARMLAGRVDEPARLHRLEAALGRACQEGRIERVLLLAPLCSPEAQAQAMALAAQHGHLPSLRALDDALGEGAPIEQCLLAAAGGDQEQCLAFLLPKWKGSLAGAFDAAAESGSPSCLKFLLARKRAPDSAMRLSARKGHLECVRILAPSSSPKALARGAFEAARSGKAECLAFLAPLCPPSADWDGALNDAASLGHVDCVNVLLERMPATAWHCLQSLRALGGPCLPATLNALAEPKTGPGAWARRWLHRRLLGNALAWAAMNRQDDHVQLLIERLPIDILRDQVPRAAKIARGAHRGHPLADPIMKAFARRQEREALGQAALAPSAARKAPRL